AEVLDFRSHKLREHLAAAVPEGGRELRPDPARLRQLLAASQVDWLKAGSVPAMTQMLQAEDTGIRLLYAETLALIRGREASEALARRAVLDLSPEVREQAIVGLRGRPHDEFVPVLVGKLRYAWAPAADHAAEALVALGLKETVPELVRMLGEPDPALPTVIND